MNITCRDCGKDIIWTSMNADRCSDCWDKKPIVSMSQKKRIISLEGQRSLTHKQEIER